MKLYRGEHAPGHPNFPEGSAAECKSAERPVDIDTPDIAYSKDDDEVIDEFHRAKVETPYHSVN